MRRRREPVLGALSFTRGEWQGRGVTLVNADDVRSAAQILDGVVHTTPLQTSEAYSRLLGASVVLKCEHLQRTGSFKVRGALVRLARLSEAERAAGVVAASAGNHAQGVAWSATRLGIAKFGARIEIMRKQNDDQLLLVDSVQISQSGHRLTVSASLPNSRAVEMMQRSFGSKAKDCR